MLMQGYFVFSNFELGYNMIIVYNLETYNMNTVVERSIADRTPQKMKATYQQR
jgi:hypothetical protein